MADLLLGAPLDRSTGARVPGATTVVRTTELTTHGIIVGMTGSGKTGLGVVLVEEALRAGVPCLLIDPKGDLTNLALLFPGLAESEFAPWVEPPATAAEQAATWRDGLAAWGLGAADVAALRASASTTVYTPGSTAGTPLDVVGSLRAPAPGTDAETVADEVDGFVSGLLAMVGIDADPLSSREHILLANLLTSEWAAGRDLDLATLVGLVRRPPLRRLGVFELDAFFPPADRETFALRLNGLLASPSFEAWMQGPPLDIDALLRGPGGEARCAVVTTSHLSDAERQFVTTLVLSKLVTWMRRQSGTSDLRALLYMDEVVGYLPPTAAPPTKQPIMTLMKQARAFGVGVVLSTQNPVDIDYKAIANAGTWMIGRLQTERDKQRLLEGMSAATGGVDLGALGDTISGLGKRQFVLRRAGSEQPELFTTRWAMSYLRGPLTRDQIAALTPEQQPHEEPAAAPPGAPDAPDALGQMPRVAEGVVVRWVDPAAPWLAEVGADARGSVLAAAAVATIALRYDDDRADLVHDELYEAVVHPLDELIDAAGARAVDHDPRDLLAEPPASLPYLPCPAPIHTKAFWTKLQRALVDHLVRARPLRVAANRELRLVARPGEDGAGFAARCAEAAQRRADADIGALQQRYDARFRRLREQVRAAEDRAVVLRQRRQDRREAEVLDTVGTVLGSIFGGRRRSARTVAGSIGRAAGRSRGGYAGIDAAERKVLALEEQLLDLRRELEAEVAGISDRWAAAARAIEPLDVPLERTDVTVQHLVLGWLPVSPPSPSV